jgi:hypothetical protein
MTLEERLAQAEAALLDFQSEQPRSREDAREAAEAWLAEARHVTAIDLAPVFTGGGSLHPANMKAAIEAFIVASPEFERWLLSHVDGRSLLPQKKRQAKVQELEKAVRGAEKAVARDRLANQQRKVEVHLAAFEDGARV